MPDDDCLEVTSEPENSEAPIKIAAVSGWASVVFLSRAQALELAAWLQEAASEAPEAEKNRVTPGWDSVVFLSEAQALSTPPWAQEAPDHLEVISVRGLVDGDVDGAETWFRSPQGHTVCLRKEAARRLAEDLATGNSRGPLACVTCPQDTIEAVAVGVARITNRPFSSSGPVDVRKLQEAASE